MVKELSEPPVPTNSFARHFTMVARLYGATPRMHPLTCRSGPHRAPSSGPIPSLWSYSTETESPCSESSASGSNATEFIGYSNHGFIEGEDGIIVMSTAAGSPQPRSGQSPSSGNSPINRWQRLFTPTSIWITLAGIGPIMAGQPERHPCVWARRLGALGHAPVEGGPGVDPPSRLPSDGYAAPPRVKKGTVGNGIGPSPVPEPNDPLSFPPTIDVDQPLDVVIAGVPLRIMPMEGDVTEHIWVWLPEDRVLFSGDSPPPWRVPRG